MSAAAAPSHHRDGTDVGSGHAVAVARKRTREVRAGAAITRMLQHHVHEARAPQASAAGWIAADITPCFGDDIRRTQAARDGGGARSSARPDAGIAIGKASRLHLRHALPARPARDMAVMIVNGVTACVSAGTPP